MLIMDGESVAMMSVFERPPNASCRSRVSLESRYGMRPDWVRSDVMTLPSVSNDLLMFLLSCMRAPLELPVDLAHSLPARSTRCSLELRSIEPSWTFSEERTVMV